MLREDVLSTTDELLVRAAAVDEPEEQASLYREQLMHVTDQVRRLVASEDDGLGGQERSEGKGGRAVPGEPLAPTLDEELLRLRKELSLTKLELAEVSAERDELEHKVRTMYKQADAAAQEALGF